MRKIITAAFFLLFFSLILLPKGKISASSSTLEFVVSNYASKKIKVEVVLDTKGTNVSTVTANFIYPADKLTVSSVVKNNSFCSNIAENNSKISGVIKFSCFQMDPMNGKITILTAIFDVKTSGSANFSFTNDAVVIDADSVLNSLETPKTKTFDLSSAFLTQLPQTGSTDENVSDFRVVFALTLFSMIVIFAVHSFTVWGGIYLTLGNNKSKKVQQQTTKKRKKER